jgi:cell wall-associated NlpC family hydrolase
MDRPSNWLLAACVLAFGIGATGCASGSVAGGGRPSPFPGAAQPDWAARDRLPRAGPLADILEDALDLQGRPYTYGGTNPLTGFDCSGLVWYVFLTNGVQLPRTTAEQFELGRSVDPDAIAPGDLVFFSTTDPGPSHVGIALDQDTLIHAPSTGSTVRIERFDTPYWQTRLTGVRRLDNVASAGGQGPARASETGERPSAGG